MSRTKTIFTLNIENYCPEIRELTFPLMQHYADKIGADFYVITERKFPQWPVVYEKLQIQESSSDWNIFLDADSLVSPEFFDVTNHMGMDTIAHNGKDMAGIRWSYDDYFRRDGRHFGSCNWFTVSSAWCARDLYQPLDMTPEEAYKRIHVTIGEHNSGQCKTEHLIDDYTLSRNIARYGLKTTTAVEICASMGFKHPDGRGYNPFLFHLYTLSPEKKVRALLSVLSTPQGQVIPNPDNLQVPLGIGWGLMSQDQATEFRRKWGIK